MIIILQYGVPLTSSTLVDPNFDDIPKSAILIVPSFVTSRLAPLISLWITPCSWRYVSPTSTWDMYTATSVSGSFPKMSLIFRRDPFSTNSMTMLKQLPAMEYVMQCTMLGWFRLRRRSISAIRDSFWSSVSESNLNCLIATKAPPST